MILQQEIFICDNCGLTKAVSPKKIRIDIIKCTDYAKLLNAEWTTKNHKCYCPSCSHNKKEKLIKKSGEEGYEMFYYDCDAYHKESGSCQC